MKSPIYPILLLLFLSGCREQPKWMKDLQAGDRQLVTYHQPGGRLAVAKPDQREARLMGQANQFFSGHPEILADIASGLKSREREITDDFEPRQALADSQGNLILVYFGRYPSPVIMAGVKVLFLFSRENEPAQIFVYEVPLE
jgi:hypothetical protein